MCRDCNSDEIFLLHINHFSRARTCGLPETIQTLTSFSTYSAAEMTFFGRLALLNRILISPSSGKRFNTRCVRYSINSILAHRIVVLGKTVKFALEQAIKAQWGRRGTALFFLLTSALDEGGCLTSHSGCLTPGKETRYPLYKRLGRPQGRPGRVRKISHPPGFNHRTVQPVASRLCWV